MKAISAIYSAKRHILFLYFAFSFREPRPGADLFCDYFGFGWFVFPVYSSWSENIFSHFSFLWTRTLYSSCTRGTVTLGCNHPSSALFLSSVKTRSQFACVLLCVFFTFFLYFFCLFVFFPPSSHTLTVRCLSDDFIKLMSPADCVVRIRLGCSCSRWSFHVRGYILHVEHNRADSGWRRAPLLHWWN